MKKTFLATTALAASILLCLTPQSCSKDESKDNTETTYVLELQDADVSIIKENNSETEFFNVIKSVKNHYLNALLNIGMTRIAERDAFVMKGDTATNEAKIVSACQNAYQQCLAIGNWYGRIRPTVTRMRDSSADRIIYQQEITRSKD